MSGLLGRHEYQIDAKGRASLPSAFRRAVSGRPLVLLQWQESHLDLFPEETWSEIRKNLLSHRKAQRDGGAYLRRITSSAVEVEPDKHGRIRVPLWLLERAGLGRHRAIRRGAGPHRAVEPRPLRRTPARAGCGRRPLRGADLRLESPWMKPPARAPRADGDLP